MVAADPVDELEAQDSQFSYFDENTDPRGFQEAQNQSMTPESSGYDLSTTHSLENSDENPASNSWEIQSDNETFSIHGEDDEDDMGSHVLPLDANATMSLSMISALGRRASRSIQRRIMIQHHRDFPEEHPPHATGILTPRRAGRPSLLKRIRRGLRKLFRRKNRAQHQQIKARPSIRFAVQ